MRFQQLMQAGRSAAVRVAGSLIVERDEAEAGVERDGIGGGRFLAPAGVEHARYPGVEDGDKPFGLRAVAQQHAAMPG
ncbi:hypothetical protein IU438_12170 [Nocardia cyriacigeorgica]|uniref:hypothetical protein n=1 Tax=Nocardia cyriacigeorgica TaxID=135487 RepID=UPI001892F6F8|nr:hypothetical protein [Nocardia cyriacigeorgica]MBF6396550.1 hypothetical protein [Nocardia cyriacigeorgica]MBF6402182.1 hypothetical protein [Nocardia cyriacigeorgica]MBF6497365.1 hypothetical protein [Nocardia cyriacigeorgica]